MLTRAATMTKVTMWRSTEVRQSTATRLAAAAANPQLAKTLDASSSLADNYSLLGVLGKGSYGEVRLAIHKLTKKRVAVKTLTRAKLTDAKLRRRAEAEVKVHKLLRHAHIARLFEVISSQASINLCMQHAAGGTLRELLDQHGAHVDRALETNLKCSNADLECTAPRPARHTES